MTSAASSSNHPSDLDPNSETSFSVRSYLDAVRIGTRAPADLLPLIERSRIIHFDSGQVVAIKKEVDAYVHAHIYLFGPEEPLDNYVTMTLFDECAMKCTVPSPMPFPSIYLGFGHGLPVDQRSLMLKLQALRLHGGFSDTLAEIGPAMTRPTPAALTQGLFVSDTGCVLEHLAISSLSSLTRLHTLIPWRCGSEIPGEPDVYMPSFETIPWLVRSLVHLVNEHRTLILDDEARPPGYRRRVRKALKETSGCGNTPPPFYRVKVRNKVLRARAVPAILGAGTSRSFRSDVRGHERVRVKRGELPLDSAQETLLRSRGYRVYTDVAPLPIEDHQRLLERGVESPREGEWVALKLTWVRSHVSPSNEDLPYVPSVHVIESDRLPRQPIGGE